MAKSKAGNKKKKTAAKTEVVHKLTKEQLVEAAKDLNKLGFDPELSTDASINTLEKELKGAAKQLTADDKVSDKTRVALENLGCDLSALETTEKTEPEPDPKSTSKKKGAGKKTTAKKGKESKEEEKEKSRYGHQAGSMSAFIDDLVHKGVTLDEATKEIVAEFDKEEENAQKKFLSHVKSLQLKKGITIRYTAE